MDSINFITMGQACSLLKVSRPTFNKIREAYSIKGFGSQRRRLLFNQAEIVQKVIASQPRTLTPVNLTITNPLGRIDQIILAEGVFDLRAVNNIDPYGVLSILATVRQIAANNEPVNITVIDN